MNLNDFAPGPELYQTIRGSFVMHGTTLTQWCRANDVNPTAARATLVGAWNGPKGRELREKLIQASGILSPSQRHALKQSKSA